MSSAVLAVPALLTTTAAVAGGMSGALHATRRKMDVTGVLLVAVCTGVGGGALRDVILGTAVPIFLIQNLLAMAFVGAVAGFFFARFVEQLSPAIYVVDSLLIGVWVVIGAEKALQLGLSDSAAVFLGLTTAVGGGIIRDVLCREVPTTLMPGQWVAGAAALAAVVFVALDGVVDQRGIAEGIAIGLATALRMASARYGWVTPDAVTMSARLRHWLGFDRRKPPAEPDTPVVPG
ncbi:MAG: TRIC cation channel family protein [Actinomycetia bacterium]|nr:TRIC cation channel family protein [Actinomycetes bacterium]